MSENLNPIVLEVEEVRVINAVSPTVDLERMEDGASVTVHDYRGTQNVVIYDGPVGPVGPQGPQGESGAETAKAIVEEAISRMADSIAEAQAIGTTVAGYRDSAATSAASASASETAAGVSASAASGSETAAAQNANNAASSASAASGSATAADTSRRNAAQSETNAGNSASAASQSAQAALQSATNAATSERNAADSAQDAHDVLDSIPEDYSTLSTDVTNLKSAVSELESLDNAPAIINTASGSIASFDDGADDRPMKRLVAHIELVQDLHGYDHPWPAGGGKNKWAFVGNGYIGTNGNIASSSNTANGYCEYVPIKAGEIVWVTGTFVNGVIAFYDTEKVFASQRIAFTPTSNSATAEVDGFVRASINIDNSTSVTAESCVNNNIQIVIDSVEPSKYYSYSNICPIEGWTGAKVTRTGANIWGGEKMADDVVEVVADGSYASKGSDSDGNFLILTAGRPMGSKICTESVKFKADTQYTAIFKCKKSNTNTQTLLGFLYTDETVDSISFPAGVVANTIYTVVATSSAGKTLKAIRCSYQSGTTYFYYENCGLFEGALTQNQFKPYQGQTYEVTFLSEAGTVYGGNLDVVSGVLTVDRAGVDMGALNWVFLSPSSWNCFSASIPGKTHGETNFLNSRYPQMQIHSTSNDKIIYGNSANSIVYVRDTAYGDATAFKEAVTGGKIVYNLATPLTYQLTPTEVKTLLGQNNVWADTGNVDVTYQADTKLYIDKKFTELQALILENIGG